MVDFLIFLLFVWGAWRLIKFFAKAYFDSLNSRQEPGDSDLDTELIRDPQCGAYFLKQEGIRGVIGGRTVYFCSRQCYERYVAGRGAK
jgi:YHS domain-containing protein